MISFVFGTILGCVCGVVITACICVANTHETAEWVLEKDAFKPHYGCYRCTNCGNHKEKATRYCPTCGKYMTFIRE